MILEGLNRHDRRAAASKLKSENNGWPATLTEVPKEHWPPNQPEGLLQVWRSKTFMAQLYNDREYIRLTVSRAVIGDNQRWAAEITWDELQSLKRQAGFGDVDALELYPRDRDVVNVANMRHLWLFFDPVPFGWRTEERDPLASKCHATAMAES